MSLFRVALSLSLPLLSNSSSVPPSQLDGKLVTVLLREAWPLLPLTPYILASPLRVCVCVFTSLPVNKELVTVFFRGAVLASFHLCLARLHHVSYDRGSG